MSLALFMRSEGVTLLNTFYFARELLSVDIWLQKYLHTASFCVTLRNANVISHFPAGFFKFLYFPIEFNEIFNVKELVSRP